MVSSRKGQSALEYMTTYGWAMTVVLVVIGALYIGFFPNPDIFVSEQCSFVQDFSCENYIVRRDGVLNMSLRNLVGMSVNITSVTCIYGEESYSNTINRIVGSGEQFYAHCDKEEVFARDIVNLRVHIDYIREGYSFERRATGSITARPVD